MYEEFVKKQGLSCDFNVPAVTSIVETFFRDVTKEQASNATRQQTIDVVTTYMLQHSENKNASTTNDTTTNNMLNAMRDRNR